MNAMERSDSSKVVKKQANKAVLERIPVTWKRSLHVGSNWCILAG